MKFCQAMTDEMAKLLSEGANRTDSCVMVGIHYDTFLEWLKKKPEFSEAIKKAEATCKQRNIKLIQRAAITTWQAAAWWLERRHHDEYSIKQRYEHSGPNGQNLSIQIDSILEFLEKKTNKLSAD